VDRAKDAKVAYFGMIVLSVAAWFLAPIFGRGLEGAYGLTSATVVAYVNVAAALCFFVASCRYVQKSKMNGSNACGFLTIAGAVALFFSGVVSDPVGATVSSLLQIASAIAFAFSAVLMRRVSVKE